MYVKEIYNFYLKHFSTFSELREISANNLYSYGLFLMVFTMIIQFAPIFTIICVISVSKYVSIQSFKLIRGFNFSELHPMKFNSKIYF